MSWIQLTKGSSNESRKLEVQGTYLFFNQPTGDFIIVTLKEMILKARSRNSDKVLMILQNDTRRRRPRADPHRKVPQPIYYLIYYWNWIDHAIRLRFCF